MGSTHFRPLSKFIGGLRRPLVLPHTEQLRFHTHKRSRGPILTRGDKCCVVDSAKLSH